MAFVPRFNRKRSVARTKPSRAKSAVVLEPQRGDLTKPRPTAWVSKPPINPRALKGRPNKALANGLGQRNPHQPPSPKGAT
jgi:hypothetical protein